MAFAIESSTSATPALNATSVTFSHTVTAANLLVLMAGGADSTSGDRAISSATYAGAAFSAFSGTTFSDNGNFERVTGMQKGSPTAGANNVVVNYGGTCDQCAPGVTGFTDADTATFGTPAAATANDASASVTITSASGEIVIAGVATDADVGIIEGGTLLWEREAVAGDSSFGAQWYNGASSVNATWTLVGSTGWAAFGISIKPSGGGGGRTLFLTSPLDGLSMTGVKQFNPSLG